MIILQSDGSSRVVQGDATHAAVNDSYTVVLSRTPKSGSYVIVTALPPKGLVFFDGSAPIRTLSNTQDLITLAGVTDGTFDLGAATGIPYNATAADIMARLAAAGYGTVNVTQDGPTYTLEFLGANEHNEFNTFLTNDAFHLTGGVGSIIETVKGHVSVAGGVNLCFDAGDGLPGGCPAANGPQNPAGTAWYHGQTLTFGVDDAAASDTFTIPAAADITHRVVVSKSGGSLVVGHVKVATSIDSDATPVPPNQTDEQEDANPLGGFDEYASIVTNEVDLFSAYPPTQANPEGLRGLTLKITGNDLEAEGQIRVVEGSYIETIHLSGVATGTNFKLTISGQQTADIARVADANAMAAALQSALQTLLGTHTATVAAGASAGDFVITLQSNLYLAWDSAAGVAGIGVKVGSTVTAGTIDASSIKLNAPWTATPNAERAVRGRHLLRRPGAERPRPHLHARHAGRGRR